MSEVEKMYENVGIEKEFAYLECHRGRSSICCPIAECEKDEECMGCINSSAMEEVYEYPPFTAEKQLELIKLLSYYYNITISKNFENDYTFQCEGDDVRRYVFTSGQDFAEQMASFVNMCYELLPEEERKQIKEILE